MAIKFQYNKTSLQGLDKQLKVRKKALPTLKNKESALRSEVQRAKDEAVRLEKEFETALAAVEQMTRLWNEFDSSLLSISNVELIQKKIAGVITPVLVSIQFDVAPCNLFNSPVWFADGIAILKNLAECAVAREVFIRKMELLDFARKKTTQKVNLYEKIQIPGFEDAMLKIKRFLEDEENLSKSAQKIVKTKQLQQEEML
ncbi:MAG: V-type ATP synthase subunit D [Cytophagaceae bacterium]|jgi:V/A-type H+-transporting ATPase subunit D|nr:V-type ATP synthase subunit D [Cytophagaceae bacterium]